MKARISIDGVETNYTINTTGTVINIKTGRVLKHWLNVGGYPSVSLYINGKSKHQFVHRLLAQAFIKNNNPKKYPHINHKDLNKKNFDLSNLEWSNPLHNSVHAFVENNAHKINNKGIVPWKIGKKKYRAVLSFKGKVKTVGYYYTFIEAFFGYVKAYLKAYGCYPLSTYSIDGKSVVDFQDAATIAKLDAMFLKFNKYYK